MGSRLGERLREALQELGWWAQAMDWPREHGAFLAPDLSEDVGWRWSGSGS